MTNSPEDDGFSRFERKKLQFIQSAAAWLGYGPRDDVPKILYFPEDLQLAAYDQDSADEVNLHVELAEGWCSCGVRLEYAGIPLQAQKGHLMHGEPTPVFLYESIEGLKLQCQECLFEWPVFESDCSHISRDEPAHCHNCMHDLVDQSARGGCAGHNARVDLKKAFSAINQLSKPGFNVYLWSCGISLLPLLFEFLNIANRNALAWPRLWQIIAIIGAANWLLGHYFGESDPNRAAKFKARAFGSWLWSIASIFIIAAVNELDILWAQASAMLGLG
ncbi:MAG: hypothetical protein RL149_498 [Actinomycetota bacterium]|jgi:hypothetical protein